ncbi:interferon-induced transmembrane protein 1-like isoform X2 [Stegastes partitus]|uniref:Interferon-induced transmembrane protein 1-like isoform X2 n=1 Tax=Stegastes partitus TaxID=144197 RepID=A0A9Y4JZ02_9TELE|nr:PREDICTED: interferon-induced transmembrane protein 1-like isoform X2 [Stegastes partitus]
MNPSKESSTPLQDWTEEKSPMGHPAPPPYQDAPYPEMPPPGPGYPPQQGFPPQYGGPAYGHQPYPMVHQYPAQPGTVTVQPTVFVSAGPLANPVNDYLGYSIFTLLFCCLPLGVAALIYSISAREANHVGDQVTAERSSRMARTLNHVALGLGIGGLILTLVFVKVLLSA